MRLAFVDDSQNQSPLRRGLGPLVALGGVVFPDNEVRGFSNSLTAIRERYSVPSNEEFKWKPPRGSYLASDPDTLRSIRREMLEAAHAHGTKTVVVILDHSAAYSRLSVPEAGRELLRWLFERFAIHLAKTDDVGAIVVDKPGGGHREDARFLHETLGLTNDGTEYVTADRVVLPILTAPSHHLPQLQLADLVVAATTAAIAGLKSGMDLADLLRPLMLRNALNSVNGTGVVLWPNRYNLLFHAFGETSAAKASAMTGVQLPYAPWPFFESGLETN